MGLLSTLGGFVGNYFLPGFGGVIGSALGGAIEGQEAVGQASEVQQQAAQGGIDEQRRQFDAIQQLLQPYTQAGTTAIQGLAPFAAAGAPALQAQQAFLGLQGPEAERAAINRITSGQTFQELARQGEEAILSRASATGGLRGGNVQAALAQFRPALLSGLIEQQYSRLGGLTALGSGTNENLARLGQASAAGTGAAGQSMAANVGTLLGRQGAAEAGGILGQQQILSGGINKAIGAFETSGGFDKLFGNRGFGGTAISGPTSMSQADYAAISGF